MNQDKIEEEIEDLELHDKSESDIEKVVSALSTEGMELRKARKTIRYQLYRLKGEAEGRCSNLSEEGFKEIFEEQRLFDGWRNFSVSWDVAMDDPYRILHRTLSVQEEWNDVVKAKFPSVAPGGKITYPDIKVKKKVEAEAKLQKKAKKKKTKKKTKSSK